MDFEKEEVLKYRLGQPLKTIMLEEAGSFMSRLLKHYLEQRTLDIKGAYGVTLFGAFDEFIEHYENWDSLNNNLACKHFFFKKIFRIKELKIKNIIANPQIDIAIREVCDKMMLILTKDNLYYGDFNARINQNADIKKCIRDIWELVTTERFEE